MLASVTKVESDVHKDTLKRLLRKSDVNIMGKVCSMMHHVMLYHVILCRTVKLH